MRFDIQKKLGAKTHPLTQEEFLTIIKDEKLKAQIKAIRAEKDADKRGKLKKKLPAVCWQASFKDGKRNNENAIPSGLYMLDVDHIKNAPTEAYMIGLKAKQDSNKYLGIRVVHVSPSGEGIRIVAKMMPEANCEHTIAGYQQWLAGQLELPFDASTKDLARMSFLCPEEDFEYCDLGVFTEEEAPLCPSDISPKWEKAEAASEPLAVSPAPSLGFPEFYEAPSHLGEGVGRGAIPYSTLVESLQELLGGVPAHGSRNNFIFSMAAYLRYVCDDDPNWIASILPTYGEARDKWRRTIDSACQRAQYKVMPSIVKRAIENARNRTLPLGGDEGGLEGETSDLPPAMPKKLPRLIQHLVKNVPEVCRAAVANAVFPALAAHLKDVKFWLIDGTEKEATFMCVNMAKQSSGKSAVNKPIEYIVADIVERDELNRKREQEWKDACANKGANKEKPKRPDDLCVQVLVSDMTNAAFVQRMKDANGKYLYTNLEELDLLKQLQTNGTKDIGKIICLCFDNGKYGQERVGTQSVTARVDVRWNWNASSTIQKGLQFFKGRMVDGTLSRVNFCTIITDKSKPFVYGRYDDKYAETLKPYITNLNLANGTIECKEALALAQQMSEKCAEEGALSDDEVYQDMAYRAVTIAYMKAMVLYIANDMTWTKDIAEFAQWSLEYDLWCKCHFFGHLIAREKALEMEAVNKSRGPRNMLDMLPDTFSLQEASEIRMQLGMTGNARLMLRQWIYRGYVELNETGKYFKTEKYLTRGN